MGLSFKENENYTTHLWGMERGDKFTHLKLISWPSPVIQELFVCELKEARQWSDNIGWAALGLVQVGMILKEIL